MRIIALDVHRAFAQMAVLKSGAIHDAGKVDLECSRLLRFVQALRPDDEIVLPTTCNASAIVRLLTKDFTVPIQSQRRLPSPHSKAAAPGDELGRV
jgi:hypothetical protein